MRTEVRQMDWALGQQYLGQLLYQNGIDDSGRDGRVAEHVLLDPRRVDDVSIQIDERFAIGEVERSVGMHLAPDEHVFGCERDLLVAFAHVGADGSHYLVLRKIDLRIQVRKTELAAAAASCGHLDDAKRSALVGE